MEAFQTSGGASTLPESFRGRVRELDYKTIRYPGHCEKFKLLLDLGLASADVIEVDGARLSPRRLLAEMLHRHLPADGPDVVLVRVEFRGLLRMTTPEVEELDRPLTNASRSSEDEAAAGVFPDVSTEAPGTLSASLVKRATLRYDIVDLFDERTGLSAMMRTTAFPASIIAQMMAGGQTMFRGAVPQERSVRPEAFVAALRERNIKINESLLDH
jgi:lysine 6-dehydrogenase